MSTGRGTARSRAASLVEAAIAGVAAPRGDPAAVQAHLGALTKPPGSLGRLESLALQVGVVLGDPPPPLDRAVVYVFAADHGVAARGVSAYPAEVTAQMCANFAGGGAAINVLTRACGAEVRVVDVGVAADLAGMAGIEHRKVRPGTEDLSERPAMTADEVVEALGVGVVVDGGGGGTAGSGGLNGPPDPGRAAEAGPGPRLVGVGEMGIGNTTAAAAVVACLTGAASSDVVGRGTGVDDAGLARKRAAVDRGVARVRRVARITRAAPDIRTPQASQTAPRARPNDTIGVLRQVGGLEIAAMAGAMIGAAARGALVLVDGFISSAAALAACRLCPALPPHLVASHRSTEPGHAVVLDALGLVPLLDLEMHLGEGSGCALAIPVVRAAGALLREMATFESAGISGPEDAGRAAR